MGHGNRWGLCGHPQAGEALFGKKVSRKQVVAATQSKIESTRALVTAMSRTALKPKVFINGSSIGVYGFTGFSDDKLTEKSPMPAK